MDRQQKQMLRVAQAIHDQYVCLQQYPTFVDLPDDAWQSCQAVLRKAQRAQQHGWYRAANRLRHELANRLDRFRFDLENVVQRLPSQTDDSSCVSALDIYRDILALHDEFDDVSWDLRAETLSVNTADIVLEGVFLGPFEIRLDFSQLTGPDAYQVVALDPRPAASDTSVTHPHVQSNLPCEGDARMPIRQALKEGRLTDFFLIVRNLLNTYNAESPFVSLENWDGVSCSDCGATVGEDNRSACEACGADLCDYCYALCSACECVYCSQCLETCGRCDEATCRCCLKPCSKCGERFCPDCLSQKGVCETCHEQDQHEDQTARRSPKDGASPATIPGAAVQPDRVGEVAVPA